MGCNSSRGPVRVFDVGHGDVRETAHPAGAVGHAACHLRVFHFNDVYSLEALPSVATAVRQCSGVASTTLVTLAGDFLGPSVLSMLDGGEGMVDTLIASGVTHVCFGNHEQDVQLAALRKHCATLQQAGVKWVNTNMPAFEPSLPADDAVTVVSRDGSHKRTVKIGGFMTNEESLFREGSFGDAWKGMPGVNGTAAAWSRKAVGEEGFDTTLVMTHQDQPDDEALAAMGLPISLILGGHDHFQRYVPGHDCLVCKTGKNASHACVIDLVWGAHADCKPTIRYSKLRMADYEPDAAVRAVAQRHETKLRALETAHLFRTGTALPRQDPRRAPHRLAGQLLAAARAAAKTADVACCSGGAVRGDLSLRAGEAFSYKHLLAVFPYELEALEVALPGAVLQAAILETRAEALCGECPGFLQLDTGVEVDADGRIRCIGGEPFDAAREYRVLAPHTTLAGTYNTVEALDTHFGRGAGAAVRRSGVAALPHADAGVPLKLFVLEYYMRLIWERMPAFAALDRDGSGRLSRAEVLAAVGAALRDDTGAGSNEGGNALMARLLIEALDADSDGRISRAEYESILQDGIGAR